MRYFTSDLHLGDKNLFAWRGFSSQEDHDAAVVGAINATVGAQDELWLLGDLCKPTVAAVSAMRDALACRHLRVVVGNHDQESKFATAGGFESVERYDEVGKAARDGYKLVLCHYPMLVWNRSFAGAYMLHGHIHSRPSAPGDPPAAEGPVSEGFGLRGYNEWNRAMGVRRYDVGVDANGLKPVSAEQVVAFFA